MCYVSDIQYLGLISWCLVLLALEFGHERVIIIALLGQINNEYFYVLLCVNLKGQVYNSDEE